MARIFNRKKGPKPILVGLVYLTYRIIPKGDFILGSYNL
jgi:hypothetical protein